MSDEAPQISEISIFSWMSKWYLCCAKISKRSRSSISLSCSLLKMWQALYTIQRYEMRNILFAWINWYGLYL